MRIQGVDLKDGRNAKISFLNRTDSAEELQDFINNLVKENAKITYDRHVSLKDEKNWIKAALSSWKRKDGYVLIARVGGRIAGTSGANRERGRGRGNVMLGLAVAEGFRGIGLGEALLRANIEAAERFFNPKPDSIYLSVLGNNKPALALYRKVGFRKFAVFPRWLPYGRRRVDHIFMRLDR